MAGKSNDLPPQGAIAVIFTSTRREGDDAAYGEAADRMEALALSQPGYLGIESARGEDRFGITVSFWADEASALAWRANAEHAAIREIGRAQWYRDYRLIVAQVTRSYDWQAPV